MSDRPRRTGRPLFGDTRRLLFRDPREASPRREPDRARRRDYPPGAGAEMDEYEVSAMVGSRRRTRIPRSEQRSQLRALATSPVLQVQQALNPSDEDESSENFGQGDTDDPPRRSGLNRTTIGFEFEFLLAVSRITDQCPDPHPNDGRWISDHLINVADVTPAFKYTACNRVIDELRNKNVAARKMDNYWSASGLGTLDWWDSLEYDNPNGNDALVSSWTGSYNWNPFESDDDNALEAIDALQRQFLEYHTANNLPIHMTRDAILQSVRDNNIRFSILGAAPFDQRDRIATIWHERVRSHIQGEKRRYHSIQSQERDPNFVGSSGTADRYRAWTCTEDFTIISTMPEYTDYTLDWDILPINTETAGIHGVPPDLYKWWGAEVISPVLDYNKPETYETLKTVCKALRDALRIHKPMTQIGTGVHVHIGQEAGWTLLHLKKFATLWHLLEDSMYHLHRRERTKSLWAAPLATKSILAIYIFDRDEGAAWAAATTPEPQRSAYARQMRQYVPNIIDPLLQAYFHHIWQYALINDLNDAMQTDRGKGSIRWRLKGLKLTSKPTAIDMQTLEFRLLQGTLDTEHVWRWASICERLVIFARDSPPAVFYDAIQSLLNGSTPGSLGLNQDDLDWFASRQTDDGYFAYPDPSGQVDWGQPFMIQGYRDTHKP
ncbi:hypothetical protein HD806DRAFT_546413 [Xylariaceae sp. AK1471]|nr:hypothetical protein HD806DRAFT_546413 [Xylariaceae sp. AK1471]